VNDTREQNTHWISEWIQNDPAELSWRAREVAREAWEADDYSILRDHLEGILRAAEEESTAWYVARQMSDADYDRTDWAEVADDLLSE
jgi:hypothetical protein